MHRRAELPVKLRPLFGAEVEFGAEVDEVVYPATARPRQSSMRIHFSTRSWSNTSMRRFRGADSVE